VLAVSACVLVPLLALTVLAGGSQALLPGRVTPCDEFRVYECPPPAPAGAARPAQPAEPAEVELTTWEKTLKGSNSM
jgi:hypothetical protein